LDEQSNEGEEEKFSQEPEEEFKEIKKTSKPKRKGTNKSLSLLLIFFIY